MFLKVKIFVQGLSDGLLWGGCVDRSVFSFSILPGPLGRRKMWKRLDEFLPFLIVRKSYNTFTRLVKRYIVQIFDLYQEKQIYSPKIANCVSLILDLVKKSFLSTALIYVWELIGEPY